MIDRIDYTKLMDGDVEHIEKVLRIINLAVRKEFIRDNPHLIDASVLGEIDISEITDGFFNDAYRTKRFGELSFEIKIGKGDYLYGSVWGYFSPFYQEIYSDGIVINLDNVKQKLIDLSWLRERDLDKVEIQIEKFI